MRVIIATMLIFSSLGCSEKNSSKDDLNNMKASNDMPTPKSEITTTNPNEDLAPQTCYYGCKARK